MLSVSWSATMTLTISTPSSSRTVTSPMTKPRSLSPSSTSFLTWSLSEPEEPSMTISMVEAAATVTFMSPITTVSALHTVDVLVSVTT